MCGAAPASAAGRGNDEPKGGGNGAGPGPRAEPGGRKEEPGRAGRVGALADSPAPGNRGGGPVGAEAGRPGPLNPPHVGGPWPRRRVFPRPPCRARRAADRHGSRRPGGRERRGGRFPSRGPERGECKDGLQCEAGTTRRKPPSRAHLSVGTFMTGQPATPEPEPREPQPQGRGRPDASPAGTGTLQATGPRGACPPGPHPRAELPSEGLGRECPAALAGSGPGPPAAPLG